MLRRTQHLEGMVRLRSIRPDGDYYAFLDTLDFSEGYDRNLASLRLMLEFPFLKGEEARAVCLDWTRRTRQTA